MGEVIGEKSGTKWAVHPPVDMLGNQATLYVSPETGLRGMLIATGEPLSNVHVVIATEANTNAWSHKDDGLPHTLEHAIFLGSELYPFKGILDKLANRSLADGTNAWTATDHTCYTLTTAGHEGALNLFPIYADHILYPCLSDSSFTTEVHHVNGLGEDKGVVYCEMQGRENTEGSLVDRAVLALLYPGSGYAAETGGKMSNLRALTNAQVRQYHAENYVPSNILFVLSGTADPSEFLSVLDTVEARVRSKPAAACRHRPWVGSPPPPLDTSAQGVLWPAQGGAQGWPLKIGFPSEDEACGCVSLAWRGPPYADRTAWIGIKLLWRYLTDSAASPLQKAFVECDDALCADLRPAHEIFTHGYHQLWFTEAAVETIDQIAPQFFVAAAAAAEAFDVDRMQMVIRRFRRRLLEQAEREPTDTVIDSVVHHFLYAPRPGEPNPHPATPDMATAPIPDFATPVSTYLSSSEVAALAADVDVLPLLEAAEALGADVWVGMLQQWVIQAPCVAVIGLPSGELAATMSFNESTREAAQAAALGPERLAELARELEIAIEYNEREISEETLRSVPIPSLSSVRPIPLLTIRGDLSSLHIAPHSGRGVDQQLQTQLLDKLRTSAAAAAAAPPLPAGLASPPSFWTEWAHIDSSFVYVALALDTSSLSHEQRLLLPLLLELAFKLPTRADTAGGGGGAGRALSKDEFVSAIQDETVSYDAGLGVLSGTIPQMVGLRIHLEASNGKGFVSALTWLRRALYLTQFSPAEVRMGAQRLANEIPAQVRDGMSVVRAISAELNFDNERANAVARSPFRQQAFLSSTIAKLDAGGSSAASIVSQLNSLRSALAAPSRMQCFVAGDLTLLTDPMQALAAALTPPPAHSQSDDTPAVTPPPAHFQSDDTPAVAPPPAPARPGDTAAPGGFASPHFSTPTIPPAAAPAAPPIPAPAPPAPLRGCAASDVLSGVTAQAVVVSLSAIESTFMMVSVPGVGAYHADHAPLLVAVEYLTALEGDFWVKIRGAGLAYGASMSNSSDSRLLSFTLYRCADFPAACAAAQAIIVDYAAGDATIPQVALDGARSSLAYGVIAGMATKLDAAKGAWLSGYQGKEVNYDQWLLERIAEVTAEDVLHALKRYIVPLFDPLANVSVACPANKRDQISSYLTDRGCNVLPVPEEKLIGTFGGRLGAEAAAANGGSVAAPERVKGSSKFLPGAFAKQFVCGCPRCIEPGSSKRDN